MNGYLVEMVNIEVDDVQLEVFVKAVGEIDCYADLVELRDIKISEMYSVGGAGENLDEDYEALYENDSDFHNKVYKAIEQKLPKHHWERAWYE